MDVALKITLVASIILMGYNISEFAASYEAVCEKTDDFKKMVVESEAKEGAVRRSNLLLSLGLSLVFVGLTYLSGLALWISGIVAAKLLFSLFCSDSLLVCVLRLGHLPKKFYMLSKVDSFFNALLGLAISFVLIL